jgi:hypothetical protein
MIYPRSLFKTLMIFYCVGFLTGNVSGSCQEEPETGGNNYYISKVIDCRSQLKGSPLISKRSLRVQYSKPVSNEKLSGIILTGLNSDTLGAIPVVASINWLNYEQASKENILTANIDFYVVRNGSCFHEFQSAEYLIMNKHGNEAILQ